MKFQISYPANLFFFVDNMSRWDLHTREGYAEFWKKQFGWCKGYDQKLRAYSGIRRKYGWGKLDAWMILPLTIKGAKKATKKNMAAKDYKELWEILGTFQKDFDILWKGIKPDLERARMELKKRCSTKRFEESVRRLRVFYGVHKKFDVYLHILSTPPGVGRGGGANAGGKNISVEVRQGEHIGWHIPTILHEYAHAMDRYGFNVWNFCELPNIFRVELLYEAIVASIFPIGYLGRRYYGKTPSDLREYIRYYKSIPGSERYVLRYTLARKLIPMTKRYFRNNRPLDRDYMKKAIKLSYTVM